MKILRIALRNLASLGGLHVVDFTREPLRTAGLYAISGPTGSGKSTLLDALCLALYERTPRLHAARGEKLPDGAENITPRDPANLLRRGTGEGFAEVAFVGADGASYTARWSVRRARGRAEGGLQPAEMVLFRGVVPVGGPGVVEQGGLRSEVLAAIVRRVGLSFSQFTRAVLLAQNDFAAFLKASDSERAEILQALTGTERFEALSQAVYARREQERRAVAELAGRREGAAPLPPEERLAAEERRATLTAAARGERAAVETREKEAAWFQQERERVGEQDAAERAVAAARQARAEAEGRRAEFHLTSEVLTGARALREQERSREQEARARTAEHAAHLHTAGLLRQTGQELAAAAGAAEHRWQEEEAAWEKQQPGLQEARRLEAVLGPLAEQARAAEAEQQAGAEQAARSRREEEEIGRRQTALQAELAAAAARGEALAPFAPFAREAGLWQERLRQAAQAGSEHAAALRQAEAAEEACRAHEAGGLTLREGAEAAHRAWLTAQGAQQAAEAVAAGFSAETLQATRREAHAAVEALRALREDLAERERLARQEHLLQAELRALTEKRLETTRQQTETEKRWPVAREQAEKARLRHELARQTVGDTAALLRPCLVADLPCPVCGAEEHPFAAEPPPRVAARLEELHAEQARAEEEERTLFAARAALGETVRHLEEEILARERARQTAAQELQARCARPVSHPAAALLAALPPQEQAAALPLRLANEVARLAEAEARETERLQAEKALAAARQAGEARKATAQACREKLREWEERAARLGADRLAAAGTAAASQARVSAAAARLQSLWEVRPELARLWAEDPSVATENFAAEAEGWRHLQERSATLEADRRELLLRLPLLAETRAREEGALAKLTQAVAAARARLGQKQQARARLFAGQPVAQVERIGKEALARARQGHQSAREKADLAARQAAESETRAAAAGEARLRAEQEHAGAAAALTAWLAALPARTGRSLERPALDALLERDHAWLTAERAFQEGLEAAGQKAEGLLAAARRALETHAATRPASAGEPAVLAALQEARVRLAASEEQREEARAVLLADDERRRLSDTLAAELHRRQEQARPWESLNALIGSADGGRFRALAQRHTLDILLRYANYQLDLLSARYRLQRLPESLNLLVIDRDMGEERRSVHSLSGGEAFLVSLGLALGLASLTSNRLRIESLFIDEGFGSLDAQTLEIAMAALMRLEAQGRKVGVITHVREMAEAIHVQIRVEKGRGGASRLAGAGVVPPTREESLPTRPARDLSAALLRLLRAQHAAGVGKVSSRWLREQLGCTGPEFSAARTALGGAVVPEGKSLRLAEPLPSSEPGSAT